MATICRSFGRQEARAGRRARHARSYRPVRFTSDEEYGSRWQGVRLDVLQDQFVAVAHVDNRVGAALHDLEGGSGVELDAIALGDAEVEDQVHPAAHETVENVGSCAAGEGVGPPVTR